MRFFTTVLFLTCLPLVAASVEPIEFQSRTNRGTMIELYTSEGCSSCPRAEAWLNGLKEDPRLWKQIFPLAFHVDYWDRLGWPDRFADAKWTARQRSYGQLWRSRTIYTPGFAVDGKPWTGFFTREPLPAFSMEKPGVLQLSSTNRVNWRIQYQPTKTGAGLQANVALLGFDESTAVGRGENRGRQLKHDFVVLNVHSVPLRKHAVGYRASIKIAPAENEDATYAVVAWLSSIRNPSPIQVTGGWLRGFVDSGNHERNSTRVRNE